jgi:hypothetical protein
MNNDCRTAQRRTTHISSIFGDLSSLFLSVASQKAASKLLSRETRKAGVSE